MVDDRRRANRHQLVFNALGHHVDRDHVIGDMSNLPTDGLIFVTEEVLPVRHAYCARIPLPVVLDCLGELTTKAGVVWIEPATHPAYDLQIDEEPVLQA